MRRIAYISRLGNCNTSLLSCLLVFSLFSLFNFLRGFWVGFSRFFPYADSKGAKVCLSCRSRKMLKKWVFGWKNRPRYSRERSRLNFPPRATSGQISQVSFFALPAQEHSFVASKRTQSSAKWYAVRYEVEDGRRERRRWWWRWGGCFYSLKCFIGFWPFFNGFLMVF